MFAYTIMISMHKNKLVKWCLEYSPFRAAKDRPKAKNRSWGLRFGYWSRVYGRRKVCIFLQNLLDSSKRHEGY